MSFRSLATFSVLVSWDFVIGFVPFVGGLLGLVVTMLTYKLLGVRWMLLELVVSSVIVVFQVSVGLGVSLSALSHVTVTTGVSVPVQTSGSGYAMVAGFEVFLYLYVGWLVLRVWRAVGLAVRRLPRSFPA